VIWPQGFEPERASVHVANAAPAIAPPDRIWPWLVRPERWPAYYSNARWVRHVDGPWPEVAVGSRFRWWTFGLVITSVVTECEPHERLAWTWSGLGARGHHGFVVGQREWGTVIVTEETVFGAVAGVLQPVVRPVMLHFHQRWVEGLARASAAAQ
jgi:hypothetical protein